LCYESVHKRAHTLWLNLQKAVNIRATVGKQRKVNTKLLTIHPQARTLHIIFYYLTFPRESEGLVYMCSNKILLNRDGARF